MLADCVADTALALFLDVPRRISAAGRHVRRGDRAAKGRFPPALPPSGMRVEILGLERIAQAVARRLEAFDGEIHYHSRRPVEGSHCTHQSLARDLAATADVLVAAAAGGPGSAGLADTEVLENPGPVGWPGERCPRFRHR